MANMFKLNETVVKVGETVKVFFGPGNSFDGIVIMIKGSGENQSFTVRRLGVMGIGIERIFPIASPLLTKIEVKKQGKVRRAKIYYLRTQTKKQLKKLTRGQTKAQGQTKAK